MSDKHQDTSRLIEAMIEDHRRFGQSLDQLQTLVSDGTDPQAAKSTVVQFELVLSRHIYAENEILVPELELKSGTMETHAVGAMLQDHDKIRSLALSLLHMVKRDANAVEVLPAIRQLRDTLSTHTRWEEEEVYPMLTGVGADDHAIAVMHGEEDEDIFGDIQ